jgi:membrane-associated phospholipid phosphatase
VQLRFHHLSDVAGGALLGTVVAKLVLGRSTGG